MSPAAPFGQSKYATFTETTQRTLAASLLIWLAWAAAPYPLSMLTTEIPGAQELSMARRAATPPKDAPYPMLVGTAMTGRSTRPPMTLGKRSEEHTSELQSLR